MSRPAVGFPELQERLEARLKHLGIKVCGGWGVGRGQSGRGKKRGDSLLNGEGKWVSEGGGQGTGGLVWEWDTCGQRGWALGTQPRRLTTSPAAAPSPPSTQPASHPLSPDPPQPHPQVTKVLEEEYCLIPMGGVLPKHPQRVLAIGGTAGERVGVGCGQSTQGPKRKRGGELAGARAAREGRLAWAASLRSDQYLDELMGMWGMGKAQEQGQ